MIKAVIFDVDGVLLDSFEANYKFHSDLMAKFGYNPATKEQYRSLFHNSMKDNIKVMTKSTDEEEIERIWEAGKNQEVSYHDELLTIPKYLKETLELLAKNYVLGIVTSRVRESVFSSTILSSLRKYFKAVIAYQDTENHKPHPGPLLLAAQKLGFMPEECVYIGDVENDMIAARAAGMKVIIYSKNMLADADASTTIFDRLPEIISKL